MRRLDRKIPHLICLAAVFFLTGCDWDSGSQANFNTSGGSSSVNISGVYRGTQGSRAVQNTSNGNITFLTIQQSGNRVTVTDNQGSTYEGSIGAPLFASAVNNGIILPGAVASTYQISFTGKDGVAARDVEFNGVITIVTVTDVIGEDVTGSSSSGTDNTTTVTTNSIIEPIAPDDEGAGTETNTTNTTTSSSSTTTTTSRSFSLTRNNNQLELNGTWVEIGGVVSGVSAIGPPAQGNITATVTGP